MSKFASKSISAREILEKILQEVLDMPAKKRDILDAMQGLVPILSKLLISSTSKRSLVVC